MDIYEYPTGIVSDGSDGAIIVWGARQDRAPPWRMYAQRVNGDGSLAWGTSGITVSATSDNLSGGAIASDGVGGAIVAWAQGDIFDWTSFDVYAQRLDAEGNLLWGPSGIVVTGAPSGQSYPEMISDEAGGAIIAWEDYRSGTNCDIYAQRVGEEEEEHKVYLPIVVKNY